MVLKYKKKTVPSKKVYKKAKYAKKMLPKGTKSLEVKMTNSDSSVTDIAKLNYQMVDVNTTSAGPNNIDERIGNKINMKSILVKKELRQNNPNLRACLVRHMIVYDRSCHGVKPPLFGTLASQSILEDNAGDGITCIPNFNNRNRFVILSDAVRMLTSENNTSGSADRAVQYYEKYVSLGNALVEYSGPGGGMAEINKGAIYVITFAGLPTFNSGTGNFYPAVQTFTTIKYIDV